MNALYGAHPGVRANHAKGASIETRDEGRPSSSGDRSMCSSSENFSTRPPCMDMRNAI
jgi:hypothetical protein